jgi:radical SAM protein with 4Fe4S-binding SPASM domain
MEQSPLQDKFVALTESFHPYDAHWELTSHCNGSCGYCYIRDNTKPDLPTDDMLRIADALSENGILNLTISGGEAFLRTDILTILQRVVDNDFFSFSLFTNGTLLTPHHLEFLVENRRYIQMIQFSAFSHHADLHDRYMGIPGSLEKIIRNAQTLQEAGIRVVIAVNIIDFNLKDFSQTRAFFTERNLIVNPSFIKLISPHNPDGVPEMLTSEAYFYNCLQQIDDDLAENEQKAMNVCLHGNAQRNQLCGGIKMHLSIDYRGDIRPCSLFTDLIVGNALENRTFASMLRSSEPYRALRAMTVADLPECNKCRFVDYCAICLGARAMEHGDYFKPDRQRCNLARAVYTFTTGKTA